MPFIFLKVTASPARTIVWEMSHFLAFLLALNTCAIGPGWSLEVVRRYDPLQVIVRLINGTHTTGTLPAWNMCNETLVIQHLETHQSAEYLLSCGDIFMPPSDIKVPSGRASEENLVLTSWITAPGTYVISARSKCPALASNKIMNVVTADDIEKDKGIH